MADFLIFYLLRVHQLGIRFVIIYSQTCDLKVDFVSLTVYTKNVWVESVTNRSQIHQTVAVLLI